MGDDYMINHQRMLQTGAALYEQPSEIGLPMAYMSSVTVGGNLKVRSRKNEINSYPSLWVWGGADRVWLISGTGFFAHSSLRFNAILKTT